MGPPPPEGERLKRRIKKKHVCEATGVCVCERRERGTNRLSSLSRESFIFFSFFFVCLFPLVLYMIELFPLVRPLTFGECKCLGGGRWGHQEPDTSPVMLVVMAFLLHIN